MNIFKYALLIIAILFIVFVGNGFLNPSITYQCEITVNKPAKECWAIMADKETMPKWIEGFKRTQLISGTENTIGAVSTIYVEDGGEEMSMEETITAYKENKKLAMRFTMDFMNMDYEILLNEKEGNTTITTNSTTEGNGIFAKSIVSFMPGAMEEQEMKNLNNLKKVIEENTKDYFPNPVDIIESDSTELI